VRKIGFLTAVIHVVIPLSFFISPSVHAKVTGSCANCHTMHNSQNGSDLLSEPQPVLLVNNCVGCHSSNTSETIITIGSTRIPIVYNTVEPAKPLAGGNFYWVATLGDSYGHNVRGISPKDVALDEAPGGKGHSCASWSCHGSLTYPDTEHGDRLRINGCEGCHNTVSHHGDDPPGQVVGAEGGWYRFLCGDHGSTGGGGVAGIEDPDWEQSPTAGQHNAYFGVWDKDHHWEEPQAMSDYCSGCHEAFHSPGWWANNGGEGGEPWLRHPSDWPLPASGEYAAYTVYNPLAPVSRPNLLSFDAAAVTPGVDMVMCLSCHRVHGSPNPDILRWDYTTMNAGGSGSGGCFICHTGKNGS
jgi:predicted CXXCH cytochrome family protein